MKKGDVEATATRSKEVDAYLAALPEDMRGTLEQLRETIRAAAPQATEVISYGMPGFKHQGWLVGFAAFKRHCSFFPGGVVERFKDKLAGYETATGTIRFQPGKPLPADLVTKIVRARVEENEARAKSPAGRKASHRR